MKTKKMVSQVGLDIHRKFSKVTARSVDGEVVWRQRLEHGDRTVLQKKLAEWPAGTPVVLESSFGWGWMSDELQDAGLDPHLANAKKVAGWRKARGMAKSDRTDADLLSELWSQQPHWWEVWLAPPEVRDRREWFRYRSGVVQMQTTLKNRIHAVLHRHGIVHDYSDLFGVAGRRFLNLLVGTQDVTLPESGRLTLKGQLQLLDQVRRQIAQATRRCRRQVDRCEAGKRLCAIPGIKYVLAHTILAEIGDVKRFPSAKHLASYSLLAPMAYDSGKEDNDDPKGRHVGFIGRRTLKWAFIEAARNAVRGGEKFRKIFDRRTNGGKRDRNRGYIAVAHELCRIVYVLLDKEVDYTETPPPRPGSHKERCCSEKG